MVGVLQTPTLSPPQPTKRRCFHWLGVFLGLIFLLVILVITVAFYLTTDSGIRTWILPRISKSLGIEIIANRVEWKPLSSLNIIGLRVGPEKQPLFQAKQITAKYHGREILRGNYQIESVILDSPQIYLMADAHGSLTSLPSSHQPSSRTLIIQKPSSSGTTRWTLPHFSLSLFQAKNLELTYRTPTQESILRNLEFHAKDVRPNQPISLTLKTEFLTKEVASARENKDSHSLHATGRIQSQLTCQVNDHFIPRTAQGDLRIEDLMGKIGDQSLDGLSARIHTDMALSPEGSSMLKETQLTIQKNGSILTRLNANGIFDLVRKEADLDIQLGPIQSNILNILFASRKIDFQNSSLNYVGHLSLAQSGRLLKVDGKLEANPLTLSSPKMPPNLWKPIVLTAEHAIEINWAQHYASFSKLNLNVTQEGKPLLTSMLNKPLSIFWAETMTGENAPNEANFTLRISPFDLTSLIPFLGLPSNYKVGSGFLNGDLKITTLHQGHRLSLEGHLEITRLALTAPTINLTNAIIHFDGGINLKDLKSAQIRTLTIHASEKGKPLITATLDGNMDFSNHSKKGSGILQIQSSLPEISALKPIPHLNIISGLLDTKLDWSFHGINQTSCKTEFSIHDLAFVWQKIQYQQIALTFQGLTEWTYPTLKIDDVQMTAFVEGHPAGSWHGNLTYNSESSDFQLAFKMHDWKESIFTPLFTAWLPEKKLRSIELTSEGDLQFKKGVFDLTTKANIKNLQVETSTAPFLKPLNATWSTDLAYTTNGTLTLRSFELQLDPTPTAKNLFQIAGTIKQSPTLFFTDLKIRGQSLDLTPYYDQLSPTTESHASSSPPSLSSPSTTPTTSASTSTPSASTSPSTINDISLLVIVDSLKIHNFVLTDLAIPFRQKGDLIESSDAHFKINGTPITLTISTKQEHPRPSFSFDAKVDGLDIAPLADTFKPELKGKVGGLMTAKVYGTGYGISQADLQQNLHGIVELAIRQAHLERLPSVQKVLQQAGILLQSPDVTNSTINDVDASGKIADGKLHTDNLHARGSAIETSIRGDIFFDQRLAMEATLKIQRAAMSQSSLLGPFLQTVSNEKGDWIQLPGGTKIMGTLTNPQVNIDTGKFATETIVNTGISILKRALEKKGAESQPQGQPQQQQQQENPIENLLNGIFKKKK